MMGVPRQQRGVSVTDLEETELLHRLERLPSSGIAFLPERVGVDGTIGMKPDYGDFMKWMGANHKQTALTLPPHSPKAVLRSSDIWLPLIYLASDTSVQVFLNMAASYLYDRAKGMLKSDGPCVHLSIIYEDDSTRTRKHLEFNGSADDLQKLMKKFDANQFFDDASSN